MLLSLSSAVVLLAISWFIIYRQSSETEKALIVKTVNEVLALLPKKLQQSIRRFVI